MSETAPRTSHELVAHIDNARDQFIAALDRLSEAQMLGPTDPAGWSVRDHLTHLAAWADGIAALLRRQDRWAAMGLMMNNPESDALDYDTINERIAVLHRELSPSAARAWLVAAHDRVRSAILALSDTELSLPYDRFVPPYTGDTGHPIVGYVIGNTADHYREHLPWIEAIVNDSKAPPTHN
jgi:hypothetical protein